MCEPIPHARKVLCSASVKAGSEIAAPALWCVLRISMVLRWSASCSGFLNGPCFSNYSNQPVRSRTTWLRDLAQQREWRVSRSEYAPCALCWRVTRPDATLTTGATNVTVILPIKCSSCGCALELDCEHSAGFGYMQAGWFRCPECREVNRCAALPGMPVRIALSPTPA